MNIATLIVNRNDPVRTDALVERLRSLASTPRDIFVIESGSDLDKLSKNTSMWVKENINWVMGFNILKDYADRHKARHANAPYDAYWMICNDATFPENIDPWVAMEQALANKPDWAIAHPYQLYFKPGHPGYPLNKKQATGARKVSFVEFVCPLFKSSFLEEHNVLFEPFTRGWGIDYLMSYLAYMSGKSIYNIDSVGTLHIPNTSHINHLSTKTEDQNTFLSAARKEMLDVLVRMYGKDWGAKFLKVIPDLDDKCFRNWSSGDRSISLSHNPG